MAVMSDQERFQTFAESMRDYRLGELPNMVKADLRAAIDAVDDWINANSASYNSALPVTARTNMTPTQKALLLMFVVSRRYSGGA